MDSILELQRQSHEELERLHRALYTILSRPKQSHDAALRVEHRASQILDRLASRSVALNNLYIDSDARAAEIASLTPAAAQNDVSEFYSRLVKLQDHHRKYPDSVADGFNYELAALVEEETYDQEGEEYEDEDPVSLLFSGEEAYGKYLDLYANHTAYANLKNIGKRPGYLQYLDLLVIKDDVPVHSDVPKDVRLSKDFETYITTLHAYLLSFVKRAKPLVDIETDEQKTLEEFEKKWEAGEIPDWQVEIKTANGEGESGIWCSACQKNYSKQTVFDAHLTSKKHIKASQKQAQAIAPPKNPNGTATSTPTPAPLTNTTLQLRAHNAARQTHLATTLLSTLAAIVNDTKSNVERRFSLTAREREQELLDQANPQPPPKAENEAGEEEEEEERIYNPLKLPLGWDGKPIPYWLYKLHGLGVEYRCEICSDHVYMGRKNFDRHFQESRHAFGMRALGLPNTKHFHEITRIEDALQLAEKLRQEGRAEMFANETMEELEDDEGNVYNRKTYEDLKKQGLI